MELKTKKEAKYRYTIKEKIGFAVLCGVLLLVMLHYGGFTGAAVYERGQIVDATIAFPKHKMPFGAKVVVTDGDYYSGKKYEKDAAVLIRKDPEEILFEERKIFGWDTELKFFLSGFGIKPPTAGQHKLNVSIIYMHKNKERAIDSISVNVHVKDAPPPTTSRLENATYMLDAEGVNIELHKLGVAHLELLDGITVPMALVSVGKDNAVLSINSRQLVFDKEGQTKEVDYDGDESTDFVMQFAKVLYGRAEFAVRAKEMVYTPPAPAKPKIYKPEPVPEYNYAPGPYEPPPQRVEDIVFTEPPAPREGEGFVSKEPLQKTPTTEEKISKIAEQAGGWKSMIYVVVAAAAVLILVIVLKKRILKRPGLSATIMEFAVLKDEITEMRKAKKEFGEIEHIIKSRHQHPEKMLKNALEEAEICELGDKISSMRAKGTIDEDIVKGLAKSRYDENIIKKAFEKLGKI